MKKCFIGFLLFLTFGLLFAQNSANSANRNTALRCLKLAENCLVGKDWSNALKQAELGLTYDDSISDLVYVKAAAEINLQKTKAYVLNIIEEAFLKDNWVANNKNGARILYADLLSATGSYTKSMSVLDSNPLIYSSDAEFIRIKNLYRIGSEESVNNARLKLNTARRVYPEDSRFPNLFFMFEYMFLNSSELSDGHYEIPEIVKTISSFYISKLPDYSSENNELELYAAFFADGEEQLRLVKALDAKHTGEHALLSLIALKTGVYSDQQAYDSFFEATNSSISLRSLDTLAYYLKEPEVRQKLMEKILNYDGKLYIDDNFDLQEEIEITYETGRPKYIRYDQNNDGVNDLYISCDFGLPLMVHFEANKSEVFYDNFPSVQRVSFLSDNYDFNFLHDEYYFSPFEMVKDSFFEDYGLEFYIPRFSSEITVPSTAEMLVKTASVSLPVSERDAAYVKYNTLEGHLVYANFYEKDVRYAYCDFTDEFPIIRYVDYDNDGYFETTEFFDQVQDDSLYDKDAISRIFGNIFGDEKIYLSKVMIDRNGNTFYEFNESYLENNGKITLWDNDDNGIWDCQYIRHPAKDGEELLEETIFFDTNGLPLITLTIIDEIPVKMIYKDSEVMIYAGQNDNFYWIDENGSSEQEKAVLEYLNKSSVQGSIDIVQTQERRVSVIRVGNNYFCKIIPPSYIDDEDGEAASRESE